MEEEGVSEVEDAIQDCEEAASPLQQDQLEDRSCLKSKLFEAENSNKGNSKITVTEDQENIMYDHHEEGKPSDNRGMMSQESSTLTQTINQEDEEILHDDDRNNINLKNQYSEDNKITQDECKHQVSSEELSYERGDREIKNESHLKRSCDYKNATDEIINHPDGSSVIQGKTDTDTSLSHSESLSYVEMKNLPVDLQESYHCKNEGYNQTYEANVHQMKPVSLQKGKTFYPEEYNSFEEKKNAEVNDENENENESHSLQYNSAECDGEYYSRYQLPNRSICQTEDQSCSSFHQQTQVFYTSCEEGSEPVDSQNRMYYSQDDPYSEDKHFETNNNTYHTTAIRDQGNTQTKCNSLDQIRANENMCELQSPFNGDEISAIDLRILRPLRYTTMTSQVQASYSMEEHMVISHEIDESYIAHQLRDGAFSAEQCNNKNQETHLLHSGYIIPDQIADNELYKNMMQQPRRALSFDCRVCEASEGSNSNLWDAATNTELAMVVDKESQTGVYETRNIGVQTDVENTILPLTFFKSIEKEIAKHTCPICQRVYISKTSYDRHRRTHGKEKNNNVIANVRFTTEAKLQICKNSTKTKNLKTQTPIIIHVPRSVFKCDNCHKNFSCQEEMDDHSCTFKPFKLIKCPECNVKFYTTGALNEHIGILHKKDNAYYCIFCNKSFDVGYNFHLHLDEHLSSQ